jgi:signal transduction histidine kinase
MAHEINNPIGGMLQNAQLLQQRVMADIAANRSAAESVGISLEAIHRYHELRNIPTMVDAIITSGERAAVIVRNMLGFARKDTGEKRPCDPAALIETALDLVRSDFDLKKKFDMKFFDVSDSLNPV